MAIRDRLLDGLVSFIGTREITNAAARAAIVTTAFALTALCAFPAQAQIDTPTARQARDALRDLQRVYGSQPGWNAWSHRLGLKDVEHELRMGNRAEPIVLRSAIDKVRAGADSDYSAPALQRLADILEKRHAELQSVPADQWAEACRARADDFQPTTPEMVRIARVALQRSLLALERRIPSLSNPDDAWRYFLSWPTTRALIYSDERDPDLLDRLEARWQGAPSVWDAPPMVEASLAVQSYIRIYRRYLANESAQEHAAAWKELASLLEPNADGGNDNAARIAAAVNRRERLGQGSALTASIRAEYSRPNVIFEVSTSWLQDQFLQSFEDRYDVNDVFAGTRSYGSGTISGTMRCDVLPSRSVAQARFLLDGSSVARTRGTNQGVGIVSTSHTTFHGRKQFALDAHGLSTEPATARADTSIVFNSINAPGFRRRRNEAVRRTYASRGRAEADASAATRREIVGRMNAEGNDLVARFNRSYTELRDRQFEAHRPTPDIRVRCDEALLRWECRLESPALFAAPGPPPEFDSTAPIRFYMAASALEDQALASLAGRELTGEQLSETIAEMFGEAAEDKRNRGDFRARFADHPLDVHFAGGQVHAKFYITSFDSDDVKYPAMTVDAHYNVEQREGELALVRQGRLNVRPLERRGEGTPALSGRQQTLRLAVQRKLARRHLHLWHPAVADHR
mgnify:FL=1